MSQPTSAAIPDPEEETPHELVLVTRFAVSPQVTYTAWTDPEQFRQWWHPDGWDIAPDQVSLDARPGGAWRATMVGPDEGLEVSLGGYYVELVPGQKLVYTLSDEPLDVPARSQATVLFRGADGGTEMEFRQTGVITDEHFEQLRAGTMHFFDRLRAQLARG